MKIEAITLREIQMPLVHFFETSFGRIYSRRILLITVALRGHQRLGRSASLVKIPSTAASGSRPPGPRITHYLAPPLLGKTLPGRESARRCWAKFAVTAWPRPPWKMRCGTRRRSRSNSRCGSCWAERGARLPAGFLSAFRTQSSSCSRRLRPNSPPAIAASSSR